VSGVKSDDIDAVLAARQALAGVGPSEPLSAYDLICRTRHDLTCRSGPGESRPFSP